MALLREEDEATRNGSDKNGEQRDRQTDLHFSSPAEVVWGDEREISAVSREMG